jgi:hypothetical protein
MFFLTTGRIHVKKSLIERSFISGAAGRPQGLPFKDAPKINEGVVLLWQRTGKENSG